MKYSRPRSWKLKPIARAFASYGRGFSKPAPSKPFPASQRKTEDLHPFKLWHSTGTFIPTEPVDRKQLGNRRVGANEGEYLGEEQRDTSMPELQICPYRGEKRLSGLWVIRAIKKGRGGPF
jgi:hypothetical protein